MPKDHDLRERFAELRREDQLQAGEYSVFLQRPGRRTNPIGVYTWLALAACLGVVLAVAVMWFERSERRHAGSPELSIAQWRSNTDFLLHTPGQEVLESIPRIGAWPSSTQIPGRRQIPPVMRKKSLPKTLPKENPS